MWRDNNTESIISFWNVFFDNVYKYPLNIWNRDDAMSFLKTYGQRAPSQKMTNVYNTECNKRESIFFINTKLEFNELITWSIDIYNAVMGQMFPQYKIDNGIFFKSENGDIFTFLTYDDVEKWLEERNYGVPRKNISHCEKDNNITNIDKKSDKRCNVLKILTLNHEIIQRRKYKKIGFLSLGIGIMMVVIYILRKIISKNVRK